MSARVLLLEDEPKVQKFISAGLEHSGMVVDCVDNLEDLDSALTKQSYDILVLDRLLKNRDSIYSIPILKQKYPLQKILVLSAIAQVEDRVAGLESGADDYLAKPFHVAELIARIHTLLRRMNHDGREVLGNLIAVGDLKINLQTQEVFRDQQPIVLTAKEFKIVTLLAGHPHKIFSKSELLDRVWGVNRDPGSNVVEVAMARIRSKLNLENLRPLLHTKRGGGYWIGLDARDD